MKTIVYIDGFNFYYGLLKGGPNKWIDYYELFQRHILPEEQLANPISSLVVKLFTADTKANFHPNGQKSAQAQATFLRAFESHNSGYPVHIIKGNHAPSPASAYPYHESSPKKPHSFEKVRVWKLEEKLTDVQLSLAIYRDVAQKACDQVVVCSNDSDISPALKLISHDYPHIRIGVVFPIKEDTRGRRFSLELKKHAKWTVTSISDELLKDSQLPLKVKTAKKPIIKPDIW